MRILKLKVNENARHGGEVFHSRDAEVLVRLTRYEIACLLRPYNGDLGSYDEVDRVRAGTDAAVQKLRDATEADTANDMLSPAT